MGEVGWLDSLGLYVLNKETPTSLSPKKGPFLSPRGIFLLTNMRNETLPCSEEAPKISATCKMCICVYCVALLC